jgi:hypothetical protein
MGIKPSSLASRALDASIYDESAKIDRGPHNPDCSRCPRGSVGCDEARHQCKDCNGIGVRNVRNGLVACTHRNRRDPKTSKEGKHSGQGQG